MSRRRSARYFAISSRSWASLLTASSLAAAIVAACGGNPTLENRGGTGGDGRPIGAGGERSPIGSGGDGFGLELGGALQGSAGEAPLPQLFVTAESDSLEVHGEPATLQISARYDDGSRPNRVVWSVEDGRFGSINDAGEFRSNGFVAGDVTITAGVGSQSASITIHVTVAIESDPDGLEEGQKDALLAGGAGGPRDIGPDGDFRFLYPYDRTVFPQGLAAPELQLGGARADATYVEIHAGDFSYRAFAGESEPTRIALPNGVWRGITGSTGGEDWVEVAVTKLASGEVTGPVSARWRIAQGSLKGFVYYNTYRSKLAGNSGAVMRMKPGEDAKVLQSGCTVCHSVSAHGNVLVVGVQWDQQNAVVSRAFDLLTNGNIALRDEQADGRVYSFGGLSPDGALMLTSGVPASGAKMRGMSGQLATRLLETASGVTVPTPSFGVKIAMTPSFSPDGSRVAFNNHDASSAGHVLSVADFNGTRSPPSFGAVVNVVTDPEHVVAWPSFLPDGSAVVYHAGDSFDTAGFGGGALYADLRLVDVESQQVSELAALNGYTEDGELYLPGGAAQEAHLNYEPSVLPVPVGGYYWVMFTSRRTFGNTIAPGGTVARGDDIWGIPQGTEKESPSPRKKIWVAAIDIDHQGRPDPSHPAFYLPGQELESGNMRAFAALEPCRSKGASCESGAECCDGFCRETRRDEGGAPVLTCTPPPDNACSNIDEACGEPSDCCSSKARCINKRCAIPSVVQ